MPAYYLDTFLGDGRSFATAFRCTSGGDIFDLRPNATSKDGFCLSVLPFRNDGPGRTFLGFDTDLDMVVPSAKIVLQSALGLTIPETILRDILSDLASRHGVTNLFLGGEQIQPQVLV